MSRPIIVDCDPGQDDAVNLLLAMSSPDELAILGIDGIEITAVRTPLQEKHAVDFIVESFRPPTPIPSRWCRRDLLPISLWPWSRSPRSCRRFARSC